MCGFVAYFGTPASAPSGLLEHRGPDQSYFYRGQDFSIEFNRLSITGGAAGEVPVSSRKGRWEVFLNGEIYNFRDLIRSWGIPQTSSDTQVVADGLEKLGTRALRDLRGMFAGIARDSNTGACYIFRDFLGEKPAFWRAFRGGVQIASECTALAQLDKGKFALSERGMSDFFRFGYVEEPNTIYAGVHAVGRGGVWLIDARKQRLVRHESLDGFNREETSTTLPELMGVVLSEQESVDVKSAVALSGGVDSAALLYGISRNLPRDTSLVSISVNLPDLPKKSEFPLAKRTSRLVGVRNSRVDVSAENLLSTLTQLGRRSDQPIGDPAAVNYLSIFERASQLGVRVVYLGHGPDEFFWGYTWAVDQLRSSILEGVENQFGNNSYWNLQGFLRSESAGEAFAAPWQRNFASEDGFLSENNPFRRFPAHLAHSYLSHNGFAQSDRLAMSFGIEPRTPFGDSRLYGWAQRNLGEDINALLDKQVFRGALPLPIRLLTRKRVKKPFFAHLSKSSFSFGSRPAFAPSLIELEDLSDLPGLRETFDGLSETVKKQSFAMFSSWLNGRSARELVWDGRIC